MSLLDAAPAATSSRAAPPPTATGPTLRTTARSLRAPLLVALALVVAGTVLGVLRATGPAGELDPDAYSPSGSRALAELLRDRGTEVLRVETLDEVVTAVVPGTAVLVPLPATLTEAELAVLGEGPGRLLVVGATDEQLGALGVDATAASAVPVERRRPACELPAAQRAGDVLLGGPTYAGAGVGCYAVGGGATLLVQDRVTLLGSGDLLTNDELDAPGSAALALGLLDADRVVWLVPRPGRPLPEGASPPLSDLRPRGLELAVVQLLLAGLVLALWRGRRLGRVVEEPLPVVVRASEAVEGRGRLYRAAGARDTAAEALRTGTRERLVRRLGLPSGAGRAALVQAVAERTGDDPGRTEALLYGPAPADDDALVRLASELSALETTLTREVSGP